LLFLFYADSYLTNFDTEAETVAPQHWRFHAVPNQFAA
jgi:hypothetical protein